MCDACAVAHMVKAMRKGWFVIGACGGWAYTTDKVKLREAEGDSGIELDTMHIRALRTAGMNRRCCCREGSRGDVRSWAAAAHRAGRSGAGRSGRGGVGRR
jgi:hypothetical protein